MKASCRNCSKEFEYKPSSSKGLYCSNSCQQFFQMKEKIESGSYTKTTAFSYFKKTTEYYCSSCGISEWNDKPLTLQIDHIDGNNKNNLISNLRYLCPNCHTQTETWGVKNVSEDGKLRMIEGATKGREARYNKEGT